MKYSLIFIIFISSVNMVFGNDTENMKLLSFIKGLYWRTPYDCPERLMVNMIGARNWHHLAVGIIEGRIQTSKEESKKAIGELDELRKQIVIGQKWPIKKREACTIPFKTSGSWSAGLSWKNALKFHNEYKLSSTNMLNSGIKWYVMWDREYLYFRIDVVDSSIKSIDYNDEKKPQPWDADCIEIFIMPSMELKSYCEFVINPCGNVYTARHCGNPSGRFVHLGRGPEIKSKVSTTSKGYIVETAIPFTGLPNYMQGNSPKTGDSIFFTMIRINDGKKYSFRPLLYDGHNYFGYMNATLKKPE